VGCGSAKEREAEEVETESGGSEVRFGFGCPGGHEIVESFPVGGAPRDVFCAEHNLRAVRVFEAPYYQEDRRRMCAPTPHAPRPDWSWTLGGPAPQSRSEQRAIEKAQGIEFVTKAEALADAAKLREGKDLSPSPKLEKGYLAKEVAKRGLRFDRSLTPPRALTREESERKLKDLGWDDGGVKDLGATKVPG
jgi:hypothetical protein